MQLQLELPTMRPNPLVNRTRSGMPRLGLISFWPKRVTPLRAGYRERWRRNHPHQPIGTPMNRRSLIACAALSTVLTASCTSTPQDSAKVYGQWQPTSAQLGGRDFPIVGFQGARLFLQMGLYEFGNDKGTITMGPLESPAQMDIHGKTGPNAGRTISAIFSVNENELVVCYQLGTGNRPKSFESPQGTQILLVRYKRI